MKNEETCIQVNLPNQAKNSEILCHLNPWQRLPSPLPHSSVRRKLHSGMVSQEHQALSLESSLSSLHTDVVVSPWQRKATSIFQLASYKAK